MHIVPRPETAHVTADLGYAPRLVVAVVADGRPATVVIDLSEALTIKLLRQLAEALAQQHEAQARATRYAPRVALAAKTDRSNGVVV